MEIGEKYTHAQVDYEHPAKGMDQCRDCTHFIAGKPAECEIVKSPIRPEDWCKKWKPV